MSKYQKICSFVAISSFSFGIVYFFIDGMLFHSIVFFVSGIILLVMKKVWNILDNTKNETRKLNGDDQL
jgi:hypothetical protein